MSEVGYFTFHKKEALKQKLTVHIPSSPVTGIFFSCCLGREGGCVGLGAVRLRLSG